MRAFLAILTVVLAVLAIGAAFVAGYVVRGVVSGDTVVLSSGQRAGAANAGDLERRVVEELQAHYYRAVDAGRLGQAGVNATIKSLDDPYTEYLSPKQTADLTKALSIHYYSGIGAALDKRGKKLIVVEVFQDSPAAKAGIKAGDWIVTIDGASTAAQSSEVAVSHIKGADGTTVTLGVRAGARGPTRSVSITRRRILSPETATRILHRNGTTVGYIRLYSFAEGVGTEVRKDIARVQSQGAKAIVFDLRYNLGGIVDEAVNVTSDFLGHGVVVTTQGLHSPRRVYPVGGDPATSLPVVVLVNHWSASASEITAGALQDNHRATIVGTRTFGKGLVQTSYPMPDGASLKMTIAVYLTPSGRDINHKGIMPTVLARDDPKTAADEALNRALQYIVAGH
jgi:carboxyl-terminal processing protease